MLRSVGKHSGNPYRQYCVLVDYEYTEYADADWLSVQTIQKHVYLSTKQSKHVTTDNLYQFRS